MRSTQSKYNLNIQTRRFAVCILLSFIIVSSVSARTEAEKLYVRVAHSTTSDNHDLNITSLGMLSLKNNMIGYADLTYLKSDSEGKAAVLDLGFGLAYDWHVSPYLSIGASLGYNWDQDEYLAAYYPEAGLIVNVTNAWGFSISGRRYYSLYEEDEDVVMLGLVFRQ